VRSLPPVEGREPGSPLTDAMDGFRALRGEPATAVLVIVLTGQSLFIGAMDVLFVVLAFDVLDLGQSGSGLLTALFGAGGLAAVFVTLGLVGRRRLAPSVVAGAALLGAAIAGIAIWSSLWLALPLIFVSNIGRSLFDVSGRTLLQRTGSPAVL